MQTVQRYDRGQIDAHETTPSGALRVRARLARIGVQRYRGSDGAWHGELRQPAEVFAADSLATYRGATITELHPSNPVTPVNWRGLTIGHVSDDAAADGDWVVATLVIHHGPAIRAILSRDLREISCGYECELEPLVGAWDGQSHAYRQRKIRINHVAIGPADWARAGRDAAIQLDTQRARAGRAVFARLDGGSMSRYKCLEFVDGRVRFDGKDYDPAKPADAQACREATLAHQRAVTPRADALEAAQVQPLIDEMQGHIAGLGETIMNLAAMVATDLEMPTEAEALEEMIGAETMDTLVRSRSEVVERARRIAPKLDVSKLTTSAIRRAALKEAGHKIDDKDSDDYVRGLFQASGSTTFSAQDRSVVDSGGDGAGGASSGEKILAADRAKRATAWRNKGGKGK